MGNVGARLNPYKKDGVYVKANTGNPNVYKKPSQGASQEGGGRKSRAKTSAKRRTTTKAPAKRRK